MSKEQCNLQHFTTEDLHFTAYLKCCDNLEFKGVLPSDHEETKLFAVTMGKYLKDDREDPNTLEFEDGWFFGIEAKFPEWPKGTDLGEMLSKARPQVLFHQGSCYFGLSYKFRNEIE